MAEEFELSEAGKKEIAEAVRILREDGLHVHKTYSQFQKSLAEQAEAKPEETEEKPEAGEGDPPPVKEPKTETKVEYGLWGKRPSR